MEILFGIVGAAVGAAAVYFYTNSQSNARVREADQKVQTARAEAERIARDAEADAETARKEAVLEAKEEILRLRQESEEEEKRRKGELQRMENRIMQREESLDTRNAALDRREEQVSKMQSSVDRRRNEVEGLYAEQEAELERIAALTREDAHKEILDRVRADTVRDEAQILRESEQRVRAQADKKAYQRRMRRAVDDCPRLTLRQERKHLST